MISTNKQRTQHTTLKLKTTLTNHTLLLTSKDPRFLFQLLLITLFLSSMAGIRLQPEDSDASNQARAVALSAADLVSDDDRSVAADSWSIKSEYGSTLDDDQRHADAAEALSNVNLRAPSDYRFHSASPISLSLSLSHAPNSQYLYFERVNRKKIRMCPMN